MTLKPTTDELIERWKDNYQSSDSFYHTLGQLQGRLDILDEVLSLPMCCDDYDILYGGACRVCLQKCDFTKEQFDIKEALK